MVRNGQLKFNRAAMQPLLVASLAFLGIGLFPGMLGVRVNVTSSLPQGLYWITKDTRARLVEFCPSGLFAVLSASRGYRLAGICPDGAAPLLKPVAATEGDIVELSAGGLRVNGRLLPNTAPLSADTAGHPLTPWPYGTYRVQPGTLWVASVYSSHSYDSRYFGPILLQHVRHKLNLLWTPFSTADASSF